MAPTQSSHRLPIANGEIWLRYESSFLQGVCCPGSLSFISLLISKIYVRKGTMTASAPMAAHTDHADLDLLFSHMRLRTLNTARKIPSEGNSGGGCRTTNESVLYYRRVRLGHLSPSSQEVKCTVESGLRTWMLKVRWPVSTCVTTPQYTNLNKEF